MGIINYLFSVDKRSKPKDWKEEACLEFFGIEEKIVITSKDMMNQDSLNSKWVKYQEWKERKEAFDKFRREHDGFR